MAMNRGSFQKNPRLQTCLIASMRWMLHQVPDHAGVTAKNCRAKGVDGDLWTCKPELRSRR
jgi:hypothetical protein